MKIKVTRAFFLAGDRQEVGAELDVSDRGLIGLLLSTGKAVACEHAKPAGPMTTDTAAATVPGVVRKKAS
jgi:hypothetical protein